MGRGELYIHEFLHSLIQLVPKATYMENIVMDTRNIQKIMDNYSERNLSPKPKLRLRIEHFKFSGKDSEVIYLNFMMEAIKVLHEVLEGCQSNPEKAVKQIRFEVLTDASELTPDRAVIKLPIGHTYKSYAEFLLSTLPPAMASGYKEKIDKFIAWWRKSGVEEIPDFADPSMESSKKAPSWRRIVKMILKNDRYCKSLSFGMTKKDKQRQYDMIVQYGNL